MSLPPGDNAADVVIVGAGPVGLSLAIDLAWRGVRTTVIEMRAAGEPPSVKCNHVAARTMETFRRLGVVAKVRNAGLPADYANDIAFRTTVTGVEFGRIPIPCRRDRYDSTDGPDTGWPTPEPAHRINQIYLEPVLFAHAASLDEVTIVNRARWTDLEQDDDGIRCRVTDLDSGTSTTLSAKFLVGCDGGRSGVRKAIGAELHGTPVVQRTQSTYIRAPKLIDLMNGEPAWGTFAMNPVRSGVVYAIDGMETWLVHNYLREDEPDFDSVDRDRSIRTILGVDDGFDYTVISQEDWFGRRLVADRFRDRRVFVCGDAAHLWVPFAGYGMNAGIADAMNLSWTLAATLAGWAGPAVLDAHEAERLPQTEQVSHFAMNHAIKLHKERKQVPAGIEQPGAEGDALRAAWGRRSYDINVAQYCAAGLNFGYFYDRSPIIAYDGEQAPDYSMGTFTPSTVPGCRAPHVWLDDGRSLYDALGPDFSLLCRDPHTDADVEPFVAAAASRGIPLRVVDLTSEEAGSRYDRRFTMCRSDQHIVWRGDEMPADPDRVLDRLAGWEPAV